MLPQSLCSANGYIEMDKDGFITLTPSGLEIASNIYERHKVLTGFFVALGVNETGFS